MSPKAIAVAASTITGIGIAKDLDCNIPPAINNAVIIPIVFCPSLAPWIREKNADEAKYICWKSLLVYVDFSFDSWRRGLLYFLPLS